MKNKLKLPLSYSDFKRFRDEAIELYASKHARPGVFVGLTELEGVFDCDEPERIFATLLIGERVGMAFSDAGRKQLKNRIRVFRADGSEIGYLPGSDSVLVGHLLKNGIEAFAYVEAKDAESGLLSVIVSIYCEKY